MKPDWYEAFELDGEEGPAPRIEKSKAKALASGIVQRALTADAGAGGGARSERSSAGGTRSLLTLVAAGAVLVGGGLFYGVKARSHEAPCRDGICAQEAPAASIVASPVSFAPTSPPLVGSGVVDAPAVVASADAVSIDALPDARAAGSKIAAAPHASAKVLEPSVAPAKTPSDLLAEANRARGAREWARAAALYERVTGLQADESYAATVALASLRLEQFGDPRSALRLYERALSTHPDGELSAQARAGIERCRRALEDDRSSQ